MKDLKELSNQCKRMACLVILLLVTLLLISAEAWAGKPGQGIAWAGKPGQGMTHPEGRLASPVSTEAANGNAQQALTVTGRVTDITGAPLPGVTVLVKNTVQGTITGSDGSYTLSNVPGNSTLMFSFVGMKTIEVAVAGKRVLNVTMEEETIDIEEVVAIGYGSLSKKEISSSIVNVNKENFNKGAVSDPMELIIGKVAGLNIDESSASPHSTSNYQIRGATSITAGNSPLVVIDGIAGGNLRNLAIQDIESITVLKDGASAAIYGTRGANGVILITTKQAADGGAGFFSVNYESYFSANLMHDLPDVLGYEEYLERDRGINYGYHDDWLGALKRDFSYDNNQYLNISGSTNKSKYSISLNLVDKTGLDKANASTQYGARIAFSQKTLNDLLELSSSFNIRGVDALTGSSGITSVVTMNPTQPIWNEDGTGYDHPLTSTGATNPVENANDITNTATDIFLLSTLEARLQLLKNEKHSLNVSANYALDWRSGKSYYYRPSTHATSAWDGNKGSASLGENRNWTKQFETTANYTFQNSTHVLRGVAGYSFTENISENMSMTNYDFAFDQFLYNAIGSGSWLAAGKAGMSSGKSSSRLVGLFGRVNYSWNDLLTATASLRYEGSSRFGANKKWGYFPAFSAAWEVANMAFMDGLKDKINSLRLRASYGVTGRQAGSNYQSIQTYTSRNTYYLIDGSWIMAYAPSKNANHDLQWELGISSDIGIDFEIFKRIRGSIEYFDRRSEDLLYTYTAPQPPFVYSSILVNVGSTKNTGVEVSLEGDVIKKKDFSWQMNGTWSSGTSVLTKLSDDVYKATYLDLMQRGGLGTSEYYFRIVEGGKIGQLYGYKHAGVNDDGELLVWSKEGEAITKSAADNSDKVFTGNTAPKHFFSWSNAFRFKNWDLSILTRGAAGMKMWNGQLFNIGLKGSTANNVLRTAYTKYDHITSDGSMLTSFFLEDGDWLKIERVTLGYNYNFRNKTYVKSMYWYVSANNLHTFTGFTGVDPSTVTSIGLTPGISGTTALTTTQVTLGVSVKF
ncbi:MAG: SusC/RagA family TonB-linked outer membrane protein [Bacteroidota bacterium]|nr:SusC/RagA family TonB-linked outer membrane protein [Bacteroidota bacterium]OQB79273.1 MAG: TonB-dependent Receptor Plug Domain protein [Bacteroidetes bacterium ADurb.Bin123]HOC87811.1 SusC/RagA family TonB-linked outer membrane protein [Prolixibacteraceae bacterium]